MCSVRAYVSILLAAGLAIFAASGSIGAQANGTACADLASLRIPDVTITSSAIVEGGFSPAPSARALSVPAFCRVVAVATPTSDSRIGVEVWIPVSGWNGKLLGTANGGFAGSIPYPAMVAALTRGYAAVGTDTGHLGDQMDFGDGHPEKIVDWGYRSIHVMTTLAKLIVRDHRGRFPDRAYFEGCSTGGQQGLSEAQRFPDDYDGIVAGDPGHNRIRLILGFLGGWLATHTDDGRPILTPAALAVATRGAVAACDAADGLKDGLISDPRACGFDPATLVCRSGQPDGCLTPDQAAAINKVYAGVRNTRTGQLLFPGWPRGSEQGWTTYIVSPREPMRLGLFRSFAFHDPHWDWRTFDWDRDVAYLDQQLPYLDATSRDLRAFKSRGGKLIMYTGLADPVVPPQDTFNYYEDVAKQLGGFQAASTFFRFFPVPGMGHCGGGAGPSTFDALAALEQWVEHGIAPDSIEASHVIAGNVDRTRPLCPYPKVARYKGVGSIDDAANFACAAPVSARRQ
jgi:feruloyl esterase